MREGIVTVAYVLGYRDPDYIRTTSLVAALARCDGIRTLVARNTSKGPWRYVQALSRLLRIRRDNHPDIYVLGFRGHELFWPIRLLSQGRPIVFDALMSPSDAMLGENKLGFIGRILAPLFHHLERHILRRADLVLTDTSLHAAFLARTFGIDVNKIIHVPVGAVEDAGPAPTSVNEDETFKVLFYGSFLKLHGIDTILLAAAKLKDFPIRFDFIGGRGKTVRKFHSRCRELGLTQVTHRVWVPLNDLLQTEIPTTDLCLGGPFGGTPQAQRVVTGKTTQALALGKATVIGNISAEQGFIDKSNCLLVEQLDPASLAGAIRWAYEHREALPDIGQQGKLLYSQRYSIEQIAKGMQKAIAVAVAREGASR